MLLDKDKNDLYVCISVPRIYKNEFDKNIMYYAVFEDDYVSVTSNSDNKIKLKRKFFFDHFKRVKANPDNFE